MPQLRLLGLLGPSDNHLPEGFALDGKGRRAAEVLSVHGQRGRVSPTAQSSGLQGGRRERLSVLGIAQGCGSPVLQADIRAYPQPRASDIKCRDHPIYAMPCRRAVRGGGLAIAPQIVPFRAEPL